MSAVLAFPGTVPELDSYAICAAANGDIVSVGDDLDLPGSLIRVHHYRGSIRVTDCNGAGKRGARLGEFSVETDRGNQDTNWAAFRLLAALPLAADFAEAERWAHGYGLDVDRSTLRGVDVAPIWHESVVVVGPRVSVSVDHRSASASDLTDRHNEPHLLTRNPDAAKAKKARAAIEAARADIESGAIGLSRVWDLLRGAGFSMHYYCGLD